MSNIATIEEKYISSDQKLAELYAALANAQAEMPSAKFNKKNPHFGNRYADLASIREACRLPLSKNGLSILQIIDVNENGQIFLKTRLAHISGAFVESKFLLKSDKNTIQGFGSVLTYAKRYSLASLLGIVADEDDDGETERKIKEGERKKVKYISKNQIKELEDLLEKLELPEKMKFLEWLQVQNLYEIDVSKFEISKKALKSKIRRNGNGNKSEE